MAYGVFDSTGNHIYTFDYGNCKKQAERTAHTIGQGYYARELTGDEYVTRMKLVIEKRQQKEYWEVGVDGTKNHPQD